MDKCNTMDNGFVRSRSRIVYYSERSIITSVCAILNGQLSNDMGMTSRR